MPKSSVIWWVSCLITTTEVWIYFTDIYRAIATSDINSDIPIFRNIQFRPYWSPLTKRGLKWSPLQSITASLSKCCPIWKCMKTRRDNLSIQFKFVSAINYPIGKTLTTRIWHSDTIRLSK